MSNRTVSVPLPAAQAPTEVISNGVRLDGRGFEESRAVFLQTKMVSQASGSAYVELNNTKVMAAVYGPRQSERKFGFSDQGMVTCEARSATCATSQRNRGGGMLSVHERELSSLVQRAVAASVQLHKIPRSTVDVHIMILEADGSEDAAAVTAASLALADAGIELYDLVPAVGVAQVAGRLLMDPSKSEVQKSSGTLLLASLPASNEVSGLSLKGAWTKSNTLAAVELALSGCEQLRLVMRQTLMDATTGN